MTTALTADAPTQDVRSRRFRLGYEPALDGFRGVSILLVLMVHLGLANDNVGVLAVNAFFVLSGFLITSLLLAEWDDTKAINLKRFYIRRALRLMPALFLVLSVFVLYALIAEPPKRAIRIVFEAIHALFYYANWIQAFRLGQSAYFGHTWSLSIEEQFYIVWPALMLFLLRKTSRQSLIAWIVIAIVLCCLTRIALVLSENPLWSNFWRLSRGLDTRADSLLCGCLVAAWFASVKLPASRWFHILLMPAAIGSIVGIGVIASRVYIFDPWMYNFGWLLASVFSVVVIAQLAMTSGTVLHKVFCNPVLVFIGKISYGLYLWHYPMLYVLHSNGLEKWKWACLALIFAITIACFYLVEKPFLRLKKRFEGRFCADSRIELQTAL